MVEIGEYDGSLCMFREEAKTLSLRHLQFFRSLADKGQLEHAVASDPRGDMRIIEVMERVRGR